MGIQDFDHVKVIFTNLILHLPTLQPQTFLYPTLHPQALRPHNMGTKYMGPIYFNCRRFSPHYFNPCQQNLRLFNPRHFISTSSPLHPLKPKPRHFHPEISSPPMSNDTSTRANKTPTLQSTILQPQTLHFQTLLPPILQLRCGYFNPCICSIRHRIILVVVVPHSIFSINLGYYVIIVFMFYNVASCFKIQLF